MAEERGLIQKDTPNRLTDNDYISYFLLQNEQMKIKPSTELIPDEYERMNNEKILVEIIHWTAGKEKISELISSLKKHKFSVNVRDINKLYPDEAKYCDLIKEINKNVQEGDYEGLLVVLSKINLSNQTMKEIWGEFTTQKCPALKNKPKIFIFQPIKIDHIETDRSPRSLKDVSPYETPSEADMLIIIDIIRNLPSLDFLLNLSENIEQYSYQEDIISLTTLSMGSNSRPLIISTMTRKFYLTVHERRGYHHDIAENHKEIKEHITTIKDHLKGKSEVKLRNKVRKFFSFNKSTKKNKSEENEHVESSSSSKEDKEENTRKQEQNKSSNLSGNKLVNNRKIEKEKCKKDTDKETEVENQKVVSPKKKIKAENKTDNSTNIINPPKDKTETDNKIQRKTELRNSANFDTKSRKSSTSSTQRPPWK